MSQDPVNAFFDELAQRGHDQLLCRGESVGRFEVVQGDRVDRWLIIIKGGHIAVSRDDMGEPDWVMRAQRDDFIQILAGELSALAALVRGKLYVDIHGGTQSFALLNRLFAGPPDSRKRAHDRQPVLKGSA
jgi:hypothetical protein